MKTQINVNGMPVEVEAEASTPLLWVLRDELNMTGTKYGCGVASCGACTVHLNGAAVRSCITRLGDIGDSHITTIEGAEDRVSDAVKAAWNELDVVQCGYCQSGQIMSAASLLSQNPKPTNSDIDSAMSGNVCRCATYQRVRSAIHRAAEILEA